MTHPEGPGSLHPSGRSVSGVHRPKALVEPTRTEAHHACRPQPSAAETAGELVQTHCSSSGSMTTARARCSHPFRDKSPSMAASISSRDASLPQPCRSNTTKPYRCELRNCLRKLVASPLQPASRPGCLVISHCSSPTPRAAVRRNNLVRASSMSLSATSATSLSGPAPCLTQPRPWRRARPY